MVIIPKQTRPATPMAIWTIRLYGLGMITYGLVIMLQAPHRWSGPGFVTANRMGGPDAWGSIWLVLGLVVMIGHLCQLFVLRNVGLFGGFVTFTVLGWTIFDLARRFGDASYGGVVICGIVALGMLFVAPAKERRSSAGLAEGP